MGPLTDGRILKLYDSHSTKQKMDDRLVFELDLADYRSAEEFEISVWATVQMFSKEKMQTGDELERYAARELIRRLLTDNKGVVLPTIREELARQKVQLSADEVRGLVEELIGS